MRTLGLKGVDLSHYQKTTADGIIMRASDNEVVGHLTEFSFGIAKATHGPAQNSAWTMHSTNIRKAGLVLGAYHWLTDADPVADQAAKFLAVAASADFLVVDQEEAGVSDADTQAFIEIVRKAGRKIGLYHSASGFGGVNADFQWVADYRDLSVAAGYPRRMSDGAEFPGWDLWQWTSKGGDEGEGLDENWMNPASPLAKLLRLGYVTEAKFNELDAIHTATITTLQNDVKAATVRISQLEAQLTAKEQELADQVASATAAKDAAVAAERERIALAMGRDMADKVRNAQ